MPGGRTIWMPKKLGENVIIPFDFTGDLDPSETITSAEIRSMVYSGVDATPSLIVLGAPAIVGPVVQQSIAQGVVGVVYGLICKVITSLNQVLEMSAFCAIETDLP